MLDETESTVIVGRVVGTRGLRGDLLVEPLTNNQERFTPGSSLFIDGRIVKVTGCVRHKGRLLVKIDLVVNRDQALLFSGKEFVVHRDDVAVLPEGSYYHFQMDGIHVWTDVGDYIGRVREILSTNGSNDVYVVRDYQSNKEVLIPALKDVILDIDVRQKKMVVNLPKGLR